MNRAALFVACLVGGLFQLTPQVHAEEDALKSIPSDAFLVLRISSNDQFIGNVKQMLGGIGPLAAAVGDEFEEEFYEEVLNLEGGEKAIDRTAPIYIVAFQQFVSDESIAVFAQVKDQDGFRLGLKSGPRARGDLKVEKRDDGFETLSGGGKNYYLAQRGDFTIYTDNENAVRMLARANTKMNSLADVLPARERKLFDRGDASVVVNLAPFVAEQKDKLRDLLHEAGKAIDALPDEQLGTASPEAAKKFYKQMLQTSFNAALDSQWAVGSAKLNAKGAAVDSLLTFNRDSGTDKLLAANPGSDLENLGRLPAGARAYMGFAIENEEWLTQWLQSNYGDNPDNSEALDKALRQMLEADNKSTVFSYTLPKDDETGVTAVTIQDAKDPEKLRDGWRAYIGALGKIENPMFTQTMTIEKNAEEYKGYDIDLSTTKIELRDLELAAMVGGLFKRMFGGDALENRLTIADDSLVQATGNDPAIIRRLLDSFESGKGSVGRDAEFSRTRAKLDQTSNLAVLVDFPRLVVDGVNMVRDLEPFAEGLEFMPFNFGVTPAPSYAGFSLGTQPHGLRMKLFVPVQQPKGVIQIFGPSL